MDDKKEYDTMLFFVQDIITALKQGKVKTRPGYLCTVMVVVGPCDDNGKPTGPPVGGSINHTKENGWALYNEAAELVPILDQPEKN